MRGARARPAATVIGIVPGDSVGDANPYCTHVVATGIGHARNLAVVASGEAVIAVGGEWGTLSEIGLARSLGRTVVALRSWSSRASARWRARPGVVAAETAERGGRRWPSTSAGSATKSRAMISAERSEPSSRR